VDEGFNTLDVLVVENGKISHRYGGGDTLGMRRAAERLIETVEHSHGVYLELSTASQLIREVVTGQRGQTHVRGRLVDITGEAKQAFAAFEADVLLFIDRSIGKAKEAYQVLLTGGGVISLAPRLLRRFPEALVMPEPVLANARGLAKLACRSGFLD
jgi:hypothetical protein